VLPQCYLIYYYISMKRIIGIGLVLVCCGVAYWLISPLFIQREVTEDTTLTDVQQDEVKQAIDTFVAAEEQGTAEEGAVDVGKKEMEDIKNMEDVVVEESMSDVLDTEAKESDTQNPAQETQDTANVIASGSFVDVAHEGSGTAKIISLGKNKDTVLSLVDLAVSNGPDLRVLLSKNSEVRAAADLGDYIEVEKLKGNIGTQHYILPEGVDVTAYRSVIIYCKPFRVVFNVADLTGVDVGDGNVQQ